MKRATNNRINPKIMNNKIIGNGSDKIQPTFSGFTNLLSFLEISLKLLRVIQ